MNQGNNQSYLDLSVLPELRADVLSNQPVVVFSEDLKEVVWSNAAGAQLFGGTGIVDLLAMQIPPANPIVKQLHSATKQLRGNEAIIRGFRINRGLRSQMLQFQIEQIECDANIHRVKITLLTDADQAYVSENKLVTAAVNALNGFADAAAIIDDFGLPLFCSEGFETLGPDEATLTALVEELASEDDRLIKRPIALADNKLVAIGLARIEDDPGRNLVVIADTTETKSDDKPAETASENVIETPEEVIHDISAAPLEIEDEPAVIELEEAVQEREDTPFDAETNVDDDQTMENPEVSTLATSMETEDEQDNSHVEISHTEREEDVRFAWSTDASGTFTFISEEFGGIVGDGPADLVGRKWSDIANVLGIDRNGEIENLLQQHDTWSGKTVLWPVENTDQLLPVNLAALPIFDTDRNFQGFRGYGKIEVSSPQHDPEEIGKAFSNLPDVDISQDESDDTIIDLSNDEPEIRISSDNTEIREVTEETNIVPFTNYKGKSPPTPLNETEREALETVRATLQEGDIADQPKVTAKADDQVDTSLLEKLPIAVLVYRNDETLFANKSLFQVSGYETLDEVIEAGGISGLLIADDGEDEEQKQYLKQKDGSTVPINAILHSVHWKGEKALLLSFAPPTEPIPDALELTRVSEVQNVLDTTTDGILLLDTDGKIISINASGEALFGLDFDDAVGRELSHLFASESKPVIDQYVSNILDLGIEGLINDGEEAIAREANGGFIPVFVSIARMEQTGKLCAVIRDITSWKKTEEELIQSKQRAELASEQKSDFLAQVSHEIRTPLNAIVGFSDLMIEERFGPIENDRYKEYLNDIRRSGIHVLDIINELLDLAKIEAGKLDLTFEAVNLNELVAETVAMLQPQANANRTIIRTSLSRIVPKVVADPRSIKQVILNLVSNAIKFSQANSQVIVSTVYESNGEVALRVRDTGMGMTESEIERAMKPFQQVHKISENSVPGTGLGLPLTKALVEANRAFFDLESNPGNGTIAHVQFPTQRVLAE